MNKNAKVVIVAALLVVVTAVIAIKQKNSPSKESEKSVPVARTEPNAQTQTSDISPKTSAGKPAAGSLPRLVDLGAKKCIPCKMMAPILEELKKEYAGVFDVDFIDVWQNPSSANEHSIRVIPTQIFYDANGKELFRHEGFFSKEDILLKWKQLGIKLEKGQKDEKNN
jgi:thioredoxin 1